VRLRGWGAEPVQCQCQCRVTEGQHLVLRLHKRPRVISAIGLEATAGGRAPPAAHRLQTQLHLHQFGDFSVQFFDCCGSLLFRGESLLVVANKLGEGRGEGARIRGAGRRQRAVSGGGGGSGIKAGACLHSGRRLGKWRR
jgi:hypothetical protein